MSREIELEATLENVVAAAVKMLDSMGKGREPSPRLALAIKAANALLGYDIAEKAGVSEKMVAAIDEIAAEWAE